MLAAMIPLVYVLWGLWLLWELGVGMGLLAPASWSMWAGGGLLVVTAGLAPGLHGTEEEYVETVRDAILRPTTDENADPEIDSLPGYEFTTLGTITPAEATGGELPNHVGDDAERDADVTNPEKK